MCLIILIALGFPRIGLLLFWLLDPAFLEQAYRSGLVLLLGFLFLPFTTLGYAWTITFPDGPLSGAGIIVIIIAVVLDLGAYGGGSAMSRTGSRR